MWSHQSLFVASMLVILNTLYDVSATRSIENHAAKSMKLHHVQKKSLSPGYEKQRNSSNQYSDDNQDTKREANTDGSDDASIQQVNLFNEMAEGKKALESCSNKKKVVQAGCKTSFKFTDSNCRFSVIVRELFRPLQGNEKKFGIITDGSFARKIINVEGSILQQGSKLIFDKCGSEPKMSFKVQASTDVKPLGDSGWLTLKSGLILDIVLFYAELKNDLNKDFFKLTMEGTGTINYRNVGIPVKISNNINTAGSDTSTTFGDEDVSITFSVANGIPVNDFMSFIDQTTDTLFPETLPASSVLKTEISTLTVTKKEGQESLVKIMLTGNNFWDAYIHGAASSSFFSKATDFYVYCKNGEPDNFAQVRCAIMSKFNKASFNWDQFSAVTPDMVSDISKGLVKDVFSAQELYFQSSKVGFEIPDSKEVMNKFSTFVTHTETTPNSKIADVIVQSSPFDSSYVHAEACVRVRVNDILKKYAKGGLHLQVQGDGFQKIKTFLIHACPSDDGLEMKIPFNPPDSTAGANNYGLFTYRALPYFTSGEDEHDTFKIPAEAHVRSEGFSVHKVDSTIKYCYSYKFYPEYDMLKKLPGVVTLKDTTFSECKVMGANDWTISGSGKEQVLFALSDVTVISKGNTGNRNGVTGKLNIFDARFIQDNANAHFLPQTKIYKKTFKNLATFPVSDLTFSAYFGKGTLVLNGKALLNDIPDISFEMIQYGVKSQQTYTPRMKLCLEANNVHVGDLVSYMYNAEMNQIFKKKYINFALIASQTSNDAQIFHASGCKNVEEDYLRKFPLYSGKGFTDGVIIYAENNDLSQCDQNDKICKFLRRCFKKDILKIKYYGRAHLLSADKSKRFEMDGLSTQIMKIGPGLTLHPIRLPTLNQMKREVGVSESATEEEFFRAATERGKAYADYKYHESRRDKILHVSNIEIKPEQIAGKKVDVISRFDYIKGTLRIESAPNLELVAKLRLKGDRVIFKVEETAGQDHLRIENVKPIASKTDYYPLAINDDEIIDEIEFNSRLLIGSHPDDEKKIRLVGGDSTIQYVHGEDVEMNKFYSCINDPIVKEKQSTTEPPRIKKKRMIKLRNVFKAFQIPLKLNSFKSSRVLKGCFTYHSGIEGNPWHIAERGLRVKKGLRLYGDLVTLDNEGAISEDGPRLSMNILFKNGNAVMEIDLPPIKLHPKKETVMFKDFKDKQSENDVAKEMEEVISTYMTVFTYEKDGPNNVGPKYTLEFNNAGFVRGSVKGYISTIGYAGPITFDVSTNPENDAFNDFSFTHTGKLFETIDNGEMTLEAVKVGKNLQKLELEVSVDILQCISDGIRSTDIRNEVVSKFSKYYDDTLTEVNRYITAYKKIETNFQTFVTQYTKAADDASQRAKRSKLERARAIQGANKRCSKECKPVEMPGLKWHDDCLTLSSGLVAGCMKFSKTRDIVSDVGCLSRCEAERVRSHVESVQADAVARDDLEELQKTKSCQLLAESVKLGSLRTILRKLETYKEEILSAGDCVEQIKNHKGEENFITVTNVKAEKNKLKDIKSKTCLMFKIAGTVNAGRVIGNFPPEAQPGEEETRRLCFDGKEAESVMEILLDDATKDYIPALNRKLDEVTKALPDIDETYNKDVVPDEKPVAECLSPLKTEDAKKFYIPGLELSPLKTSGFHIHNSETTLLFSKYSPWSTLERNNPFNHVTTPAIKRSNNVEHAKDGSCEATKRSVENYQEVIAYMKKWASSQREGEQSLSSTRDLIMKRMINTKDSILKHAGERAENSEELNSMTYWMNVTEDGMKRWLVESTNQLQHLNKEGMKLMKDQLTSMYTNDQHKSIQDFFTNIANAGNEAFKRANIARKDENLFSLVSNDLINLLEENMPLASLSPILEKIERKIVTAEKRTITCTA